METIVTLNELDLAYVNSDSTKDLKFYQHIHRLYEILFVIHSEEGAEFIIENEIFPIKPFDLFVIKPGQYHIINLKNSTKYERYVLYFSDRYLSAAIFEKLKNIRKQYKLSDHKQISELLNKLIMYSKDFDLETMQLLGSALLTELIILLEHIGNTSGEKLDTIHPLIADVIKYVSENIAMPININSICNTLFVSRSYLNHQFSNVMNISIMQYVRTKKIYYAESLLKKGIPPTKVWELCGFNDYSSFFRIYKKVFGNPPSQSFCNP